MLTGVIAQGRIESDLARIGALADQVIEEAAELASRAPGTRESLPEDAVVAEIAALRL